MCSFRVTLNSYGKTSVGELRRGTRRGTLTQRTMHELLGYLLLYFDDAYRIDALGAYAARYAHVMAWPVRELLEELAGRPVDLGEVRAGFRRVVQATAKPRRARTRTVRVVRRAPR